MPIGTERDMDSVLQGALYRNRRRRLSRVILGKLTPWSTGLVVTAGQYVSAENGTAAFLATTSGTTGATAPTGRTTNDGGVTWVRADIQSLLQFLNTSPNTPTP